METSLRTIPLRTSVLRSTSILLIAACGWTTHVAYGQEWLEFRGPGGTGSAEAHDLPIDFTKANTIWRTELPGRGWSSPVVSGNDIWLTTAIEKAASKEQIALRRKTASMPGLEVRDTVQLQALCVDRDSGKLRHQIELFSITEPVLIHSLNSFASPTPVINGDFVYCSFGTMGTAAIRRDNGQVAWRNTELKLEHETGPGSSPIIFDDLLIVHCDGTDKQFITALRTSDGQIAWQRSRSGEMHPRGMMKKAFATPTLWPAPDGPQLISPAASWVYGYDPRNGSELWKVSYGELGFSNAPRPLIGNGLIYVCTGFNRSVLLVLNCAGKSKLSEADIAWRFKNQVPAMPTPILVDELLFMVSDDGVATCLNALTGEQFWQERLGGEFSSSPIFADGRLYVANRAGNIFVVAAKAKFELLATNELDSAIMATPVAIENHLIIRTKNSLYRIEK
jgi:outer membrane protein assembly factor BamB